MLSQTLQANEIIVVDDGSTDQTHAFLADEYPQVRCYVQSNQGVSAARNAGVEAAKCDWIALLDSDDQWHKAKLEKQMEAWAASPTHRIVHSDEIWIRDGLQVNKKNKYSKQGGYIFDHCLEICAISPSSVVLEKSLLKEMGGFDEALPACEDYDLWLKICSDYPTLYVDEPLLNKYGGADDQLSNLHWGLDRFRVLALHRFLNSERASRLAQGDFAKAEAVLNKKCAILINGARKRGNAAMVKHYSALLVN